MKKNGCNKVYLNINDGFFVLLQINNKIYMKNNFVFFIYNIDTIVITPLLSRG